MIRFFIAVFAVVLFAATPARADMCEFGACGHWSSFKIDVLVRSDSMIWTDGTQDKCTIFAQDDYVTIVACTESRAGKRGKWDMYYFLQAMGDGMHVRGSRELPSCISRRSCWPQPGADFIRLAAPQ